MEDTYLADAISRLDKLANNIADQNSFDLQGMIDATEKSHRVMERLNDLAIFNEEKELKKFFKQLELIISQLNQIAKSEITNAPEPHVLMSSFAAAFEGFLNKYVSKRNQKNLSNLAAYIPAIDNIVYFSETMPYYWHYANRQEKVAMVLSVVLTTAAVAIGIAAVCSPAIAATPLVMSALWACLKFGKILFQCVIENPKHKYDDIQRVKELQHRLEETEIFMQENNKTTFPKERKTMLQSAPRATAITPPVKPKTPQKIQREKTTHTPTHTIDRTTPGSVKDILERLERTKPATAAATKKEQPRSVKDIAAIFEGEGKGRGDGKVMPTNKTWQGARW